MKLNSERFQLNRDRYVLLAPIIMIGSLALIFGFLDLTISQILVNPDSAWGYFGANYNRGPSYALITISAAILLGSISKNIKYQRFSSLFLNFFSYCLYAAGFINQLDWICIVTAQFMFLFITINKDWRNYRNFAVIACLSALIILVAIEALKSLCGRVRYEDLNSSNSNFTPWFNPPGYHAENESFPSGHTGKALMILPLLLLVKDREWIDPVKIITYIGVIGWGVFIGMSRIILGKHYASDVLFSFIISFSVVFGLNKVHSLSQQIDWGILLKVWILLPVPLKNQF